MEIVMEAVSELVNYDRNPRTTKNLNALIQSMDRFGFTNPAVGYVHEGRKLVLAGNQRLKAAVERGDEAIPVVYPPFKNFAEARTWAIADNKLAEVVAGWDKEMLAVEFKELAGEFQVLQVPGFRQDEINKLTTDSDPSTLDNEPPVYEITPNLNESYASVMIFCRNDLDWEFLRQMLDLQPRKAPMKSEAKLCHVVEFGDFIQKVNIQREKTDASTATENPKRARSGGVRKRVPKGDSPGA